MQIFCIFIQNNKFKMSQKSVHPKFSRYTRSKPCSIRVWAVRTGFSLSCLSVKGLFSFAPEFWKIQKNTFIDTPRRSTREFYQKIDIIIDYFKKTRNIVSEMCYFSLFSFDKFFITKFCIFMHFHCLTVILNSTFETKILIIF